jgi:hypothetical protein
VLYFVSYSGIKSIRELALKSTIVGLFILFLLPGTPTYSHSPAMTQTPSSAAVAPAKSTGESGSEIFEAVIANQRRNDEALETYERMERVEIRKTGSSPLELRVHRAFPVGTGSYKINLSADGKPPNPEVYRADLEKLEKFLVAVIQRAPAQQEAYAKLEKKRKERNDLLGASRQAFIFTLTGHETRGTRTLARYSMVPNPAFRPATRTATVFTRVKGTIWVDEETKQLARIEGTVTEDISIALFLAKVYKGSHFMQERYEVAPGLWFPSFDQYDFDGRKFLMSFSMHERTLYTNYKRIGPPPDALAVVRSELDKSASGGKIP